MHLLSRGINWAILVLLPLHFFPAPSRAQGVENALPTSGPLNFPTYFGINGVGYFHRSDLKDDLARRWELEKELGVQWDRSDFWWSDLEKEKGKWDFSKGDAAMQIYRDHGVQMFPILDYGARWRQTRAPANDEERAEWAEYVRRVVSRYRGYTTYWEVWNEPNILPFWRPEPNPDHYAKLLKLTADVARKANPNVKLVGFAAAGWDMPFVTRVLDQVGTDCFDVFSYHFYRWDIPEERTPDEVNEIKLTLEHYGKPNCPIWVTEMGITSNYKEGVSEEVQAVRLMRQILLLIGNGVEKVFPFCLVDNAGDPMGEAGVNLGMVTLDGRKKPAFEAYRTMIRKLRDCQIIGPVDLGTGNHALLFERKGIRSTNDSERLLVAWSAGDISDVKVPIKYLNYSLSVNRDGSVPPLKSGYLMPYDDFAGGFGYFEQDVASTTVRVTLSPKPIYMSIWGDSLDANARTVWAKNPILASPGQILRDSVRPYGGDPSGEVTYRLPEDWKSERKGSELEFTIPDGAKAKWYSIKAAVPFISGTVEKELHVWVQPAIRADVRLSFTTATRDVITSCVVRDMNLKSTTIWRLEVQPPMAGLELPSGFLHYDAAAHYPPEFTQNSVGRSPRNVFSTIRDVATINLITEPAVWEESGPPPAERHRAFKMVAASLRETDPSVDGDLTEYQSSGAMRLGDRDQLLRGDYTTTADASAVIRALWTADGIYVGADVTDDAPMMNDHGTAGEVYKGDAVELYVAPVGWSGQYYSDKEHGSGYYHFALTPGKGGEGAAVSDFERVVPGSKMAVKRRDGGYIMEAFIPRDAYGGYIPKHGDMIAWDCQLDDRDDYSKSATVKSFMWNGDDMNWLRAAKWGAMVIK